MGYVALCCALSVFCLCWVFKNLVAVAVSAIGICMCICIYTCIYISICIFIFERIFAFVFAFVFVFVFVGPFELLGAVPGRLLLPPGEHLAPGSDVRGPGPLLPRGLA